MGIISDAGSVLSDSFTELWFQFVDWIPNFLGALLIFIAGILIAQILGRLATTVAKKVYLDRGAEVTGLKEMLHKIGFKLEISQALGWLIKWFLYAVVLVAAADMLGLSQISEFLGALVLYIPNVIIAVVILIIGVIISNFVFTLVKETSTAAKLTVSDFLANIARWSILVFTVMAALVQLRVATQLILILFMGIVSMFALAGGIAFGLGGQHKAKDVLDEIMKK